MNNKSRVLYIIAILIIIVGFTGSLLYYNKNIEDTNLKDTTEDTVFITTTTPEKACGVLRSAHDYALTNICIGNHNKAAILGTLNGVIEQSLDDPTSIMEMKKVTEFGVTLAFKEAISCSYDDKRKLSDAAYTACMQSLQPVR